MVEERITDGRRIAELLASELDGRAEDGLERVAVTNADRDAEATGAGARAYDVERGGRRFARAYVHEERVRLEFERGTDAALEAARDGELAVDDADGGLVAWVESAAAVKRATTAVAAASRALES